LGVVIGSVRDTLGADASNLDAHAYLEHFRRSAHIAQDGLRRTLTDQENARKVINAAGALCNRVEVRLTSLAEETACKTAHLLEKHFTAANEAAENARICYEKAAQGLNLRVFGILTAAFLAVVLFVTVLAFLLIPSLDEIRERRAEVVLLQKNVEILERRGARFQVEDCKPNNRKKDVLCIRVVGFKPSWTRGDELFLQPWQP